MRLLLDVHIGLGMAEALTKAGHDVLRAGLAYHDWSDDRLLTLARAEARVVITEDADYTDLVFVKRHDPPISILYLRASASDLPRLVGSVVEVLANDRHRGHIVVITPSRIRYRPFPRLSADHD